MHSVGGDRIQTIEANVTVASPLEEISLGKIKLLLSSLNTSKATNSADFPSWISKESKDDICIPFHDIVNAMLCSGEFPAMWKMAQVRPLPKCEHPTMYKDYHWLPPCGFAIPSW